MKVLIFAGSTRAGSLNVKLAKAAMKALAEAGAETTYINLADYPMPIFDDDLKAESGIPTNATKLAQLVTSHDALFVASPEYNSSVSPLLKNTIDWLSVISTKPKPFPGITVALGAASPGSLGGVRGLYHLRSIFMNVGAQVITEQSIVPNANKAFDEDGNVADERTLSFLQAACRSLMELALDGRGRD
ncbi:MAG: NAD(P)H-dependent oxidoreductase [Pseudomonadota bacterium]